MKIFTLLICFLLFVLNLALHDPHLYTIKEAKFLIRQLKGTKQKHHLKCKNFEDYCDNNPDLPEELEDVCPIIFKAYLCDRIESPDGMIEVLQKYDIENQASPKLEEIMENLV